MIVRRAGDELVLVDQVEHGRVTGELAAHWDNANFAPPAPRDGVLLAAARHDEGWREPDQEPLLADGEGRPANFVEVGQERHVALYRRGVERVLAVDPYAGLLTSMHWTGLYRARWGAQGSTGPSDADQPERVRALVAETVDAEERRWIELKRTLWSAPRPRADLEAELWRNFELLQAWDVLSLALCTMDLERPGEGEPVPMGATLADLDRTPGPRLIPGVPTGTDAGRVDLTLRIAEPGGVLVDPYPFDSDQIPVVAATRRLADRRYRDTADVRAALTAGAPIRCRLRGADRRGRG